ncbi:MAG: putative DNA binding domain-containing protein [Candidatus Eisenbacteria bacterium]|uniref:DNA binding domain-containing protein n=1 Tax=Eiseniibacteriota bacterium TaxID=2212470 RepID=A0A933W1S3_UNCEI|nr:putative DNA binding domain-containing protein [Candidatus Eisenbacteria bacterium]
MTPEDLAGRIANGETLAVEFKGEAREPLSDGALVEAVVCLANRPDGESGWLLIGVEDDGRVTGARPRHGSRTDAQRVQVLVANRTRPSVMVRAEVIELEDQAVLVIEVPSMGVPISTSDGHYVRRAIGGDGKPACLPMHFHEMQSLQADRGLLDYSALPVEGAKWEDLDPLEIERFRRFVHESLGRGDSALIDLSDLDLAKALGAVEEWRGGHRIRVLGLLLFGREEALHRLLPTHEVAFQALSGVRVQVNDFFRWPLLRLFDELLARFRARNTEQEVLVGMVRVGVPDYASAAFREGVANALIHRDYTRVGAVHVQWHEDRVEITNPGGFPQGVRLDNLLVTQPRPRNPALADAFKRAGIVERTGRGIDTIFFEQLRNGRPAPNYERSNESGVALVLPGGRGNLEFARLVAEESQAERPLALDDLLLLNALWTDRRLSTAEAAVLIQKPESEARSRLQRLVEGGLVESRGERKGRTWHLSAATYRRLGEHAAYVRQHGFEPIQHEQMILQYVSSHGRITRREAAGLCQLSPDQAKRVLARLVESRRLAQHGQRKGAFYALPPEDMGALAPDMGAPKPTSKPAKPRSRE